MTHENRFCFVAPMYNASATIDQMLASIVSQSYKNWRVILIDDVSDFEEVLKEKEAIETWQRMVLRNFPSTQIDVIWNDDKQWEVANVLKGIAMCEGNDIVCRLDADDFLCDLDALRIINQVYKQTDCDCLWTAHRWFDDRGVTMQNISGPLSAGVDPYVHPWVSSHLKTFRKHLLDAVPDVNFRGADGEYFRRIGDQAVMLPAIKNSKKHVYLPLVAYAYRCDMRPETFQTDDAKFQRDEALFLRRRGYVAR